MPAPDELAEATEGDIDRHRVPDVSVALDVAAEPDDSVEDLDTSTVIVDSVLEAAAGLSDLLVMEIVVEVLVRREDDVVVIWVPLLCRQAAVQEIVALAEITVGQGLSLQDALEQTSVK